MSVRLFCFFSENKRNFEQQAIYSVNDVITSFVFQYRLPSCGQIFCFPLKEFVIFTGEKLFGVNVYILCRVEGLSINEFQKGRNGWKPRSAKQGKYGVYGKISRPSYSNIGCVCKEALCSGTVVMIDNFFIINKNWVDCCI